MNTKEKIDIYREACIVLQDWGYSAEVIEDYSGKMMYGLKTPAIESDAPGAMVGAAICAAAESIEEGSIDIIHDAIPEREDSMGLDRVFY